MSGARAIWKSPLPVMQASCSKHSSIVKWLGAYAHGGNPDEYSTFQPN